jgi:hypothetical protein
MDRKHDARKRNGSIDSHLTSNYRQPASTPQRTHPRTPQPQTRPNHPSVQSPPPHSTPPGRARPPYTSLRGLPPKHNPRKVRHMPSSLLLPTQDAAMQPSTRCSEYLHCTMRALARVPPRCDESPSSGTGEPELQAEAGSWHINLEQSAPPMAHPADAGYLCPVATRAIPVAAGTTAWGTHGLRNARTPVHGYPRSGAAAVGGYACRHRAGRAVRGASLQQLRQVAYALARLLHLGVMACLQPV